MFRIGVIGAGRLASTHCRHLMRLPNLSFSTYDTIAENAVRLASETNGVVSDSVHSLIENSDAILVVTPNDAHADYALAAIEAGKHLFIEKPLTLDLDSAQAIVTAAKGSSRTIAVGQVVRYFSMYRRAHEIVKSGKLGNPAAIRMTRGGRMPGGEGSWFADHSKSGGVLLDLAVHDFDWLLWTIGPVKEVMSKSVGVATGVGPDYALTTLTLESGAVAHVESTWMDPHENRVAFEVCGSEGMLEYDSRNASTTRVFGAMDQQHLPEDDPFFLQMKDFVENAQAGKPAHVGVGAAFEAMKVAVAAIESAKSGKIVRL